MVVERFGGPVPRERLEPGCGPSGERCLAPRQEDRPLRTRPGRGKAPQTPLDRKDRSLAHGNLGGSPGEGGAEPVNPRFRESERLGLAEPCGYRQDRIATRRGNP